MGAFVAACEAVWLKRILKDLGVPFTDLILLYYDNMSSIHLAGDINLQHISMNLQTADILQRPWEPTNCGS